MKDEVKITVIATGFQRANLPKIHRAGASATEDLPANEPEPVPVAAADSRTAAEEENEPAIAGNMENLDVPAYVRRRMSYQ